MFDLWWQRAIDETRKNHWDLHCTSPEYCCTLAVCTDNLYDFTVFSRLRHTGITSVYALRQMVHEYCKFVTGPLFSPEVCLSDSLTISLYLAESILATHLQNDPSFVLATDVPKGHVKIVSRMTP